jgi:hypothetical protein
MSRTMLNEHNLPQYFWAEDVNTVCYIINRTIIRNTLNKTPYELWNNRKPNVGYFKVFGCKCFVLNDRDILGKFDAKSTEAYSLVILQIVKHIECSINEPWLLMNLCMLFFMRLIHSTSKIIVMMSQFLLIIKLVHLTKLIQVKKTRYR